MIVTYGINKKQDRQVFHKSRQIDLPEYENSDFDRSDVKEIIRKKIRDENPGWLITGYGIVDSEG